MNKRHTLIQVILFTAVLILLTSNIGFPSGRKKEPEGVQELKFWHSFGTYTKDALNSLITSFNSEQKQVRVTAVFQGNEQSLYQALVSAGENLPDIIHVPVQILPLLREKGYITDLNSYLSRDLVNDIPDKFWRSVTINRKVYGMPFSYNVWLLYVNQNFLRISGIREQKEPESWEEVFSLALKIKQNTKGKGKWPLFIPIESMIQFISFVESYTDKIILDDGKINLAGDEVVRAMKFLQSLVYEHELMPSKITIYEGQNLFLSDNIGIMLAPSSMLVYTQSNLPYDLNLWKLPYSGMTRPVVSGACLSLIKSEHKKEEQAYRFIEYLLQFENAIKWHTHTGSPAIRKSVRDSLDLLIFYEENPNYTIATTELEKGKIFNPSFDYFLYNQIITEAIEEIMINKKDPTQVLNAAQKKIDTLAKGAD